MAWSKPKVRLSMKTYMTVIMEETDSQKNVLTSVSTTVPRNASSENVKLALQAELDKQKIETNEIAALETRLNSVAIVKGV